MISRLKPKANPLTWANIRFPGATPTRHQNSEWCPFTTWHCLYKVKQPGKMLVIKFSRDSSSPETRILTRNHICMMKKKKTKAKQPPDASWSNEVWRISTHLLRKKMPNGVSCLSPARGNLFQDSSETKKPQKKTKQGPITHFQHTPTRHEKTTLKVPPLFSPVKTRAGREAECCQTTLHIFSLQVKRQLKRNADPQKEIGLVAVCSPVIVHAERWLFFLIAPERKKPRLFFFKKMKRTILKLHFMYNMYTVLAHDHSKLDLFSFTGFKW